VPCCVFVRQWPFVKMFCCNHVPRIRPILQLPFWSWLVKPVERPSVRYNIFKTLTRRDRWAEVDETWYVYSAGRGTKLLGSGTVNFGPCAAQERWPTPMGCLSIHFSLPLTMKRLSAGCNSLTYTEWRNKLNLTTLELRRLYYDLVMCYKIIF